MMELNATNITVIFTFLAVLIAYLSYSLGKKKDDKQEVKEDTTAQTSLKMQLEYISRGVDDIKLEMRDIKSDAKAQDEKINELTVKFAQLEASQKSEHKRLDEVETRINDYERK